jgi:hypothetical protein
MCGLCGALGQGPSWEHSGLDGDESRWRLHHEAVATAAELTALLMCQRIKVTAQSGGGFSVFFPTGGVETAAGLTQIWHLLQRRKITIPDPLAP